MVVITRMQEIANRYNSASWRVAAGSVGKRGTGKQNIPNEHSAAPSSAAAPTLVIAEEQMDALPLEFLNLPETSVGTGEVIGLERPKTLENLLK